MQAVLQWAARFNGKDLPPGTLIHHSQKAHGQGPGHGPEHASFYLQSPEDAAAETAAGGAAGNGCGTHTFRCCCPLGFQECGALGIIPPCSVDVLTGCMCRSHKSARPGVVEHFQKLGSGVATSVKQMLFNRDLATTSFLLAFVWIGVAMAYYGIILLGVEVFAAKNDVCTDDDSAKISSNDFKDVFITSLGEVRATRQHCRPPSQRP